MPETTIHKDGYFVSLQDNVGSTWKVIRVMCDFVAAPDQRLRHTNLCGRVGAGLATHAFRNFF